MNSVISLTEALEPLTTFQDEALLDSDSMKQKALEPLDRRIQQVLADSIQPSKSSCISTKTLSQHKSSTKSPLEGKKYWVIDGVVLLREVIEPSNQSVKLSKERPIIKAAFITFVWIVTCAASFYARSAWPIGILFFLMLGEVFVLGNAPAKIDRSKDLSAKIAELRKCGYKKGFSAIQKEALGFSPKLPCAAFHPEELRRFYMEHLVKLEAKSALAIGAPISSHRSEKKEEAGFYRRDEFAFSIFQQNLFGRALMGSLGLIDTAFTEELSEEIRRFEKVRYELYETYDKRYLEEIRLIKQDYEKRISAVIFWKTEIRYRTDGSSYTTSERDYLREKLEKMRLAQEGNAKVAMQKSLWQSHYEPFFEEAKALLEKAAPFAKSYLESQKKAPKRAKEAL